MELNKKSNKIGILTFHFSNHNFGAVLQVFASFNILQQLGYNPTVINLLPNERPTIIQTLKCFIKSLITRSYVFEKFIKKNIRLTRKLYSDDNLRNLNSLFDAYYVGSDQVWRVSMSKERILQYFLDFAAADKIKIAYAASFGISTWEGDLDLTSRIKPLLKRFTAIAVREKDGVDICRNVFNVEASQVLDPTLILDVTYYLKIMKKNKKFKKYDYIGYHLIQDKEAKGLILKRAFEQTNIKVINLFGASKDFMGKHYLKYNSVPSWLYGIKNASYLITDSFHCVIFSILFKKEFICIPNKKGGLSRIENLLKTLNLLDRYCISEDIDFHYYFSTPIDYSKVYSKLERLKNDSYEFLKIALKIEI